MVRSSLFRNLWIISTFDFVSDTKIWILDKNFYCLPISQFNFFLYYQPSLHLRCLLKYLTTTDCGRIWLWRETEGQVYFLNVNVMCDYLDSFALIFDLLSRCCISFSFAWKYDGAVNGSLSEANITGSLA